MSPLPFSRCNGTCTIRSQRALTVQRGIRVLCSKTTGFGVLGSPYTQSKGRVSPEEQPVCLSLQQRDTALGGTADSTWGWEHPQLWRELQSRAIGRSKSPAHRELCSHTKMRTGVLNQLVKFTQNLTHQALPSAALPGAKQGICGFIV